MKRPHSIKHKLNQIQRGEIAKSLSAAVKDQCSDAVAVYLFGSFARNENFTDLDIGILMGREIQKPLEFELKLEVGLEKALRYPIDVRILDSAPLSFQFAVVRDGRLIVDSDPNRRASFEGNVRKKYFDFAVFRRRYLREVADAGL